MSKHKREPTSRTANLLASWEAAADADAAETALSHPVDVAEDERDDEAAFTVYWLLSPRAPQLQVLAQHLGLADEELIRPNTDAVCLFVGDDDRSPPVAWVGEWLRREGKRVHLLARLLAGAAGDAWEEAVLAEALVGDPLHHEWLADREFRRSISRRAP